MACCCRRSIMTPLNQPCKSNNAAVPLCSNCSSNTASRLPCEPVIGVAAYRRQPRVCRLFQMNWEPAERASQTPPHTCQLTLDWEAESTPLPCRGTWSISSSTQRWSNWVRRPNIPQMEGKGVGVELEPAGGIEHSNLLITDQPL